VADEPESALTTRVARVASSLVQIHVEVAKREADRDKSRLVRAAVLGAAALVLLGLVLVALDAALVVALHDRGLGWAPALLAVAGTNAALATIFFIAASKLAKEPIMPETRGLVQRTIAAFTEA